jgi:uncharacterized protein YndB with AHSA1/START domain
VKRLFPVLALLAAIPAAAAEPAVTVVERAEADRTTTLVHSAVIKAAPSEIWAAITTAEGWKRWAVPVAFADFRIGGEIETSYDPAAQRGSPANIRNHILAYVPGRMLAMQAVQAPPGFPHPEALARLWTVIEIEPLGRGKARVTLTSPGYDGSRAHGILLGFFRQGNSISLQNLKDSLEKGPVDWSVRLRKQ